MRRYVYSIATVGAQASTLACRCDKGNQAYSKSLGEHGGNS